jgi:uncharacterized repeat protein (TIGR01451 family)
MRTATHTPVCDSTLLRAMNVPQRARRPWLITAFLMALALLLPASALGQGGFVYVNNQTSANSVSAYTVGTTGSLTQITGSPFSTGGAGANEVCYGLNRLAVSPANNLLFVANTGDRTITPFQINPVTGFLTRAPGAPFPSGLTADSCQGFSLAVTPDGALLMAAGNGEIRTFSVAANGALGFVSSTANCCSPNASMSISPDGRFLAISNQASVSMFTISAGTLTPVAGSPFAKVGPGSVSALDFSCKADRLFGGEATGTPAVAESWVVDANGVLTPAPLSPYRSSGTNSNVVLQSPDNTLLFQSNQSSTSINSFVVNSDGSITNAGKFGGAGQVHIPVGMTIDATGTFLYVADDTFGVAAFRIGDGGVLASLQDLAINRPGQIHDVAAFPPRSCAAADLVLNMSAVPNPAVAGAPIQYTLSVTNNGPSVASAVVADPLPPTLTPGGSALIANPSGANRTNTVSGSSVSGAVTITTTVPHQLFVGESVTVGSVHSPTTPNPIQSGSFLTDPGFNGVFTVASVPSPTTFTYTQSIPLTQFPQPTLQIAASNSAQRIGGVVTITATSVFQLAPGTTVSISGVANTSFNGTFIVASQPAATTFTYLQSGADAISGGGTVTGPRVVPATDTAGAGSISSAACLVTVGAGACGTAAFAPRPPVVTANRTSNVVTITTAVPHQLFVGKTVTIQGVADSSFNGTFTVASVPSLTTFTYAQNLADAGSTGGAVIGPGIVSQLVNFKGMAAGETRTALITGTTSGSTANGTIITNRATISNMSVVDSLPGDTTKSLDVAIGSTGGTRITAPTATGPYGGVAVLTATLVDSSTNAPLAGKTVGFNFNQNNSQYNAVTDGNGIATVSVPLGFTTVGAHPSAFTINFGGDSGFAASGTTADLIVTKAQLTVTADNNSRLYGDPNPPLTYTITGFVNGDTISVVSGTADCSTTATLTSPVGTYPITCASGTLSAQNYVFAFVDGTLTVNPAPLTVTVDNALRAYGDPNPVFTGAITGLKNGDNITAAYSTTATIASPVGTYPITATLADPNNLLPNYAVTINNGTLTITPAALVVTANNAARLYGDPNPPFSGTIAGIKNNDNITAIYTTPATPASPIGTYPIIPTLTDNGTGALANYIVTANNGSLTVSPAPLVVTAANATRAYGTPNPVFTGTIVGTKNSDNITAAYSTPATQISPAGTYPIIPAVSDNGTGVLGNYIVTINNGTLTITNAILTVTADNASRFYGDPNPLFTGTVTGILNGDNITATYASPAGPASPVGTYPVIPTLSDNGTGALANYAVVINDGTLTVNPALLTVTVASAGRLYGDPNPAFSVTIVGIKNGDSITAAVSSTADPTSPVGTYPIVATLVDPTNKLSNYAVTINNGTLAINPAPLSVTANSASRLFGTPNPPFSGALAGIRNADPITAGFTTTAVATSPVGTYPITAVLNDPAGKLGNYTVTSTDGALTVNAAPTANFVFVNNQAAAGNSINGYSVAADGTLTALAGSPVATGGLGAAAACPSVNRMALSAGNNLLFVSNGGDQTISAFQIDPASGALTAAAGSPFASGLILDACGGISLSATPDGRFLMASSNGQIITFSIGAGGTLSPLFTTANPAAPNAGMRISANGLFLAVSNGASVSVFNVNPDGSLTAAAGSPFAEAGTGSLAGLDFSSSSGLLFGAEASPSSALADAWTIGPGGALSAVAGSPFSAAAINSNAVLLSPNDAFLFASNSGSVSAFSVGAGGVLSSIGSAGSLHAPVGMATDRSGSLLYVADDSFGVAVFGIDAAGSLAQLGDVAITGAGQVQDLVAYPPRMASNADLSVAISASSPNVVAGQNVTYTITLTNNGADPASATVTDALPAGFTLVSCAASGNGLCIGNSAAANFYLLQNGESQTVTLVASAGASIPDGTVTTNTAVISNNSAVDPNAANNSASASVTVAQPAATALAVAPASGTYGGSTTLSATLTTPGGPLAGETVSFTLNGSPAGSAVTDANGLASVSASLAGIAAGNYPGAVAASFAGDVNNTAASGSASLTVAPAALTVTVNNASRVYGDPNPAFTGTITGIQNGDNITAGYSTTATPTSPVGTYAIAPALSDNGTGALANYTVTSNNGTLTITSAPLTVTAANAGMVYGDAVPALSGSITGIKNGDNITAGYSTTATSASPVGTYPIVPALSDNGTGTLANYTVVSNNGTLTITSAPLTVTAANAGMVYGDAVPALSGSITGIKNGDNITAGYSTTATSASPVGTYPIVPALSDNGTGTLANYTVVSNNGTLTITSAPLTVTAANAGMVYGDAVPALSGSITGIRNGDNITATYSTTATSASPVGTYSIVPALSDNGTGALANYTVVSNNGTLTITSAPLTVTAANAGMIYGDPVPALTGTITGLKNGDAIGATFSTPATPASPVGNYAIIPALSDPNNKLGNYTVTLNNGVLSISPATLSVTAADASRLYGDPNPVFTGTIVGIRNADNITASYASAADPTTPVGTYPIVPTLSDNGTGALANYIVSATNGTLTVTAAPLAIQADDATGTAGQPFPAFTGTITGLKNGDVVTASYTTTADQTSPAGTYPIIPSADASPALANYAVTLINGTLTLQ